jgi:phosphotriesterase-related protein
MLTEDRNGSEGAMTQAGETPMSGLTVQTARGPVDISLLGRTLMHEHVFVLSPEAVLDYPDVTGWDEGARMQQAAGKLRALHAAGFGTLVDLTVLGMGRDVRRIRRLAEQTPLHIVVATGAYVLSELPWFLHNVGPQSLGRRSEPMVEMFVNDIVRGIADTGIRAGILKCATGEAGLTADVERSLRAVAQAHRETGVPISTHTDATSRSGLLQQGVFAAEGVDLTRVVIGHSGDSTDLGYLRELLDRGSTLGMDRFGMDRGPYPSFDQRIETVARLCELGYRDQLVLSHDAHCWMDWLPDELTAGTPAELPDWHYLHISQRVIPALLERGLTRADVDAMTTVNPRRILSAQGGY